MPGGAEISSAVAGLDRGVWPGPPRHTRHTGQGGAGRGRLLFPLTRQGLGDGAAPHEVVTRPRHILDDHATDQYLRAHRSDLPHEEEQPRLVHGAVAGLGVGGGGVGDDLADVAEINMLQQQEAQRGNGP